MADQQTAAREQDHVQSVQNIFAAFGQGNIPAVLQALAPDVEWVVSGPQAVAFSGTRRGRDQVVQFFAALGQTVDIQAFEPKEFIAQGDVVVVVGMERLRFKATGKMAENHWVMVFTFRDGQVARFREYDDTHALAAAAG